MKLWLCLLMGFFSFAVDDADNPPPAADPDPQDDLDLSGVDDSPPPADEPTADDKIDGAAERARAVAAEQRAEQYQRELTEARAHSRPAPQSDEQKAWDAEEARLKSKDTTDLERWQIESNRSLRAGRASSNAALFEARDVADRTSFRQLEITKPALYKRYAARVEEELGKARKNGGNAPRESILRYLIGNDALDGKLAPKKKTAAAPGAESNIQRGRLPGARSDTRGKGVPMSTREKLAAKLDGVQI